MKTDDKELSLADQVKNLFFYKEDKKTLDPRKLAGLLGLGVGASGILETPDTPVGYQGVVPRYTAVREPVSIKDTFRRPGSGGRRYFSDTQYIPEGGDVEAAKLGASQQAESLGQSNVENPFNEYNLPWYMQKMAAVGAEKYGESATNEEEFDMGPYKLAEINPIPGVDDVMSTGLAGLSGQKGLKHGGILGLKTGNPPQDEGNWFTNTFNTAKDYVSGGLESLGDMFSGPTDWLKEQTNKGLEGRMDAGREATYETHGGGTRTYGQDVDDYQAALEKAKEGNTDISPTGYGNIFSGSDWITTLKGGDPGDWEVREAFNKLSPAEQMIALHPDMDPNRAYFQTSVDPMNKFGGGSDADERASRAQRAYRNQVVDKGHDHFGTPGDRDLEAWAFGSEDVAGNPDHPNHDIYSQKLYTDGDLVGFTDPDTGKFRPLTYNHAQQAKQMGIVGEAPDTTATTQPASGTDSETQGSETSYEVQYFTDLSAFIPAIQGKSSEELQAQIAAHSDALTDNPNSANPYTGWDPSKLKQRLQWLQSLINLNEEQQNEVLNQTLTKLDELRGVTGQSGLQSGAKEGGSIEGYAFGGLTDFEGMAESPSGLLKSAEDGMGDTIPAQVQGQPINLAGGEYIMDAELVSMLGNGNTDAGAKVLDDFRENVRRAKHGEEEQGDQINPENFLSRMPQIGVA